jgi:hypothetical protein
MDNRQLVNDPSPVQNGVKEGLATHPTGAPELGEAGLETRLGLYAKTDPRQFAAGQ